MCIKQVLTLCCRHKLKVTFCTSVYSLYPIHIQSSPYMHLLWLLFSSLKNSLFTYSNCIHLRVSSLCLLMQQHSQWKINVIGNMRKNPVGKGAGEEERKILCQGKAYFMCRNHRSQQDFLLKCYWGSTSPSFEGMS